MNQRIIAVIDTLALTHCAIHVINTTGERNSNAENEVSQEFRLMRPGRTIRWVNAILLIAAIGCRTVNNVSFIGNSEIHHYRDKVLDIEYPNVDDATPRDVAMTQRPRTIREQSEDQIWEMTLAEAIQTAVMNNKMIRSRSGSTQMLTDPTLTQSVYDPSIAETGYLFGNRGVEAALADFDAQFTASTQWGQNTFVQNNLRFMTVTEGTGTYNTSLTKTFANGGNLALNQFWNYLDTNSTNVPVQSNYTGTTQAVYTQPLWAGAGLDYVRTAGPVRPGFGAITGVSQGVAISRINSDIDVAEFELAVTTMVKDVEDLYWELYLAYRQFDAEVATRDSLHRTWAEIKSKMDSGGRGGSTSEETQARENYFDSSSRVADTLSTVYITENALRKMLGLAVNDGRIIRPKDDPIKGEFIAQWEISMLDALTCRAELRRQKWQIKSLELQLKAAKNAANPQLNFVSAYQMNGFGTSLLGPGMDGSGNFGSWSASTLSGTLPGWYAGLQFSVPIGLRAARSQLHNIELQLIKARAALSAQEQDISHELAEAVQRIDAAYEKTQHQMNRRIAVSRRIEATLAQYEAGGRNESNRSVTLDLVLRAQSDKAAAEIAYYTSLIDYTKAITELNRCRGTLLEMDGIHLSEGEWNDEAKRDALTRAAERTFGFPAHGLTTKPGEFSSPVPYPKNDLYNGLPPDSEVHLDAAPMTAPQEIETPPADRPYE